MGRSELCRRLKLPDDRDTCTHTAYGRSRSWGTTRHIPHRPPFDSPLSVLGSKDFSTKMYCYRERARGARLDGAACYGSREFGGSDSLSVGVRMCVNAQVVFRCTRGVSFGACVRATARTWVGAWVGACAGTCVAHRHTRTCPDVPGRTVRFRPRP